MLFLQRKEPDKVAAFVHGEAIDCQEDFVDDLGDRHLIVDEKNAGHRLARLDALIREAGDGLAIVREENALVSGGPGENEIATFFTLAAENAAAVLAAFIAELPAEMP